MAVAESNSQYMRAPHWFSTFRARGQPFHSVSSPLGRQEAAYSEGQRMQKPGAQSPKMAGPAWAGAAPVKVAVFKAGQYWKADSPRLVTEPGTVISVRPLWKKARMPTVSRFSGRVTLFRAVSPAKA